MGLALLKTAADRGEIRQMTAVLRFRTRWLLRHLPRRDAQAVRLLPALLQASFAHRELKHDPPGVVGAVPRPAWVGLARAFNLPPPSGSQRGMRLIAALIVVPTRERLEVIAVLDRGIGPREGDRARIRLDAVEALLAGQGVKLRCTAVSADDAAARMPPGLLPFGCLVAGRLDATFFDRLGEAPAGDVGHLWTSAPTALSRLALMFLTQGPAPQPYVAMWKMLETDPAFALADPELFCARWAGSRPGVAGPLYELVAQAAHRPATRALLRRALGHPEEAASVRALVEIGRAVTGKLSRVVRSVSGAKAGPLRRAFRKEVSGPGLPLVLLPLLGAALKGAALTEERFVDGRTQVQDPTGAILGEGSAPEQAWVRALALASRAIGKPVASADASPMFARIAGRLLQPVDRRTVIAVVEMDDVPGVPADPLNRGPDRILAIRAALVVTLTPDGRPSAVRTAPFEAVGRIIREATLGTAVEVLGKDGKSDVTAARLARVAARCRAHTAAVPLVFEIGGQAVSAIDGRLRHFPKATLAARPRAFVTDPEAWDFGAAAAGGRPSRSGPRAIDCLVWSADAMNACVWYSTDDGFHLAEKVPFASLEQHMAETQKLVRLASPPRVLAVRTAPEIAERISRYDPRLENVVALEITGSLPFGLTVTLAGERFGARTGLSLRAAAETILSQWPPHQIGHLTVARLELDGRGSDAALAKLYARALVLRRLWAHIRSACRPEGPTGA